MRQRPNLSIDTDVLAARCRVPMARVIGTLDRMNRAHTFMSAVLVLSLSACASFGDPAERLVARYKRFLLADGQPFEQRVQRYLDLPAEDDIRSKLVGSFSRLGPRRGAPVWYAVVSSINSSGDHLNGRIDVYFDESAVCIRRENVEAEFGRITPPHMEHPTPHMPRNYPPWIVPASVRFQSNGVPVRLALHFSGDCLDHVEHAVRIPLQ